MVKLSKSQLSRMEDNLTGRQTGSLKRHSPHHTKKHMDSMISSMSKGSSFSSSHQKAIKKVGT